MKLPLFFPNPIYVAHLSRNKAQALHAVCRQAGVPCRASGAWIERPIVLVHEHKHPNGFILAEPQNGAVQVGVPKAYAKTTLNMARYALGALAFVLFDLVSRESIKNVPWASIATPRGRPKIPRPMSNRERQKKFREVRPESSHKPGAAGHDRRPVR